MVKRKLQRFKENLTFPNFLQPEYTDIKDQFHLKGKWKKDFFRNEKPIILELGCGKGEYTVGLAERNPDKNYLGIDIKGSRMWRGCKDSNEKKLNNVGFLRTRIDFIELFFDKEEISEIWLTFPDPQRKKSKSRKRLTSPLFLERYSNLLEKEHRIHLKTDNRNLFEYTLETISDEGHHLHYHTFDVYNSDAPEEVKNIETFYEQKFKEEGSNIHYLNFSLNANVKNG